MRGIENEIIIFNNKSIVNILDNSKSNYSHVSIMLIGCRYDPVTET